SWISWCSLTSPVRVSSTATCCFRVCRSHPTNVMASASLRRALSPPASLATARDRPHDINSGPPHISDRLRGPPRRAARCRVFLWLMSSDFFLTLLQPLAGHRRQVVPLVIRDLALPHDKDDLQPFCAERRQPLAMTMSPGPLLVVVRSGPGRRKQREVGRLIDHMPQRLVAGKAELDDPRLLAAPLRHGHGAGVRLQMPKRLPPSRGIPEPGPERRRGNPMCTDREGPGPLCRRHTREKIVDGLP